MTSPTRSSHNTNMASMTVVVLIATRCVEGRSLGALEDVGLFVRHAVDSEPAILDLYCVACRGDHPLDEDLLVLQREPAYGGTLESPLAITAFLSSSLQVLRARGSFSSVQEGLLFVRPDT